jgi:hypothetical protein
VVIRSLKGVRLVVFGSLRPITNVLVEDEHHSFDEKLTTTKFFEEVTIAKSAYVSSAKPSEQADA